MVLQRLLRGRIVFTPTEDGTGYTFEAETRFDKLFAGIAVPMEPVPEYLERYEGDRRGTGLPSDGDYGLLLEHAYANLGKGMASPTGKNQKYRVEGRLAA